ncbi:hypothetical protein ANCCAN_26477, partial [Ancylostoma caninum]
MDFLTAYRDALRNKVENIKQSTSSTCSIISEMAQLFTQDFGSLNKEKKTKLHNWFLLMKKTLEELELNDKRNAEFVSQVKRRITQVGEMLDLGGNLSVAQYLHKLESQLDYLSALYNVREEEEQRIQRSAEPSYMWPILDDWTPRIQRRILESSNVHAIRALFFKLSLSINTLCEQFQSEERKTTLKYIGLLFLLCCLNITSLQPKSSKSGTPVPALAHIFNLLLKHSDPYTNRYFENSMTWREVKTNRDVLTSRTIDLIESWVPSSAINSLRSILNHFMGILITDSFKQINSILAAVGNFSFDDTFIHSDPYELLLKQIQGNQALVQLITK